MRISDQLDQMSPVELSAMLDRARVEGWTQLALFDEESWEGLSHNGQLDYLDHWPISRIAITPALTESQLAQISRMKSLTYLVIGGIRVGPDGAQLLANTLSLTQLDLHLCSVGNDGAKALATLPLLTTLTLAGDSIGGDGLRQLALLPGLINLSLKYTPIDADSGQIFSLFRNLRTLDLSMQFGLRKSGIEFLTHLPSLRRLALKENGLDDEHARLISTLSDLQELDLCENRIGLEGIRHLSKLTALERLDLGAIGLSDREAVALSEFARLQSLALGGTRLSVEGMRSISRMSSLKELDLRSCGVDDETAQVLASHSGLTNLNLSFNRIGDSGAAALGQIKGLKDLRLRDNRIGDDGAHGLAGLEHLEVLNLNSNRLGPSGATALAQLRRLTRLNLGGNRIGDDGATSLSSLRRLSFLDISGNSVGSAGFRAICDLSNLVSLDAHTNNISDDGIPSVPQLANLVRINLSDNQIGDVGVRGLGKLPNLKRIHLAGNIISEVGVVELRNLQKLTCLDLSNNLIKLTPKLIGTLETLKRLTELHLTKNPDFEVGGDLPAKNPLVVLDRLRSKLAGTSRPWREVKIALLGDGEVGKSMIRWRLSGLPDELPPRAQDRTRAWERRSMTFAVEAGGSVSEANAEDREITAHLFDFGGQSFLWGSHRLFLGIKRSLYTVVARADIPLEGSGNRVVHWIRMVAAMREETICAMAEDEFQRRLERDDPDLDRKKSAYVERRIKDLNLILPWPPVAVVITHSRTRVRAEFDAELNLLKVSLHEFARTFGEIPLQIVDIGDKVQGSESDVEEIRSLLHDILVESKAISELWTSTATPAFFSLRNALAERFPLKHAANRIDEQLVPWITVQEYLDDISRDMGDPELALAYLPELRDVGIIHWVGDVGEHLVGAGDRVRDLIFNPAWAAGPMCEILWHTGTQEIVGVFPRSDLIRALRKHMGVPAARSAFAHSDQRLLELMIASKLLFLADQREEPDPLYIIPDHLPLDRTVIDVGSYSWRWSPAFLADSAMPKLIGKLWEFRDGDQQNRNRFRLRYPALSTGVAQTARADLVQVGRHLLFRQLTGERKACEVLSHEVHRAVLKETLLGQPEQGGEVNLIATRESGTPPLELVSGNAATVDSALPLNTSQRAPEAWASKMCAAIAIIYPRLGTEADPIDQRRKIAILKEVAIALEAGISAPQPRHVGLVITLWWFTSGHESIPKVNGKGAARRRMQAIKWYLDWLRTVYKGGKWPEDAIRELTTIGGPVVDKQLEEASVDTAWTAANKVISRILGED